LGIGRMPEFPQRFWALERVPLEWSRIRDANAETWFAGRDAEVGSDAGSTAQRPIARAGHR
jgi:hypothetical protein